MARRQDGAAFWRWVVQKEQQLREAVTAAKPDDPLFDDLLEQLQAVDEDLYFLLGGDADEGPLELIITAEGNLEAFPAVAALVKQAPPIAGWTVIAFKPPMGCEFVTRHDGAEIDARAAWFQPLTSKTGEFGVRLGCPTYDAKLDDEYGFAATQVLDVVLGELVATRDVHFLEVARLPAAPAKEGFLPLAELPGHLAARGAATRH